MGLQALSHLLLLMSCLRSSLRSTPLLSRMLAATDTTAATAATAGNVPLPHAMQGFNTATIVSLVGMTVELQVGDLLSHHPPARAEPWYQR